MLNGKVTFHNIGNINKQSISLKPFTVFVGKNNTGKTLLINALYFIHSKNMKKIIDRITQEVSNEITSGAAFVRAKKIIKTTFEKLNEYNFYNHMYEQNLFQKSLLEFETKSYQNLENELDLSTVFDNFFNNNPVLFDLIKNLSKVKNKKKLLLRVDNEISTNNNLLVTLLESIKISTSDIAIIIARAKLFDYFCTNKDTYMFPVERAGINTFLFDVGREINNFNPALQNYLELINQIKDSSQNLDNKTEYFEVATKLEQDLFRGTIKLKNTENGKKVYFKDLNGQNIVSAMFSSSINELSTFILYLKFRAKSGDIVFFDEPEISLHPDAQRVLIKYLTLLNNMGIKFIIITHSDYIVKELSHTIALGKELKKYQNEKSDDMDNFLEKIKINGLDSYNIEGYGLAGLKGESILYSFNQSEKTMCTDIKSLEPGILGYNEEIFNESINQTNKVSAKISSLIIEENDEKFLNLLESVFNDESN